MNESSFFDNASSLPEELNKLCLMAPQLKIEFEEFNFKGVIFSDIELEFLLGDLANQARFLVRSWEKIIASGFRLHGRPDTLDFYSDDMYGYTLMEFIDSCSFRIKKNNFSIDEKISKGALKSCLEYLKIQARYSRPCDNWKRTVGAITSLLVSFPKGLDLVGKAMFSFSVDFVGSEVALEPLSWELDSYLTTAIENYMSYYEFGPRESDPDSFFTAVAYPDFPFGVHAMLYKSENLKLLRHDQKWMPMSAFDDLLEAGNIYFPADFKVFQHFMYHDQEEEIVGVDHILGPDEPCS